MTLAKALQSAEWMSKVSKEKNEGMWSPSIFPSKLKVIEKGQGNESLNAWENDGRKLVPHKKHVLIIIKDLLLTRKSMLCNTKTERL